MAEILSERLATRQRDKTSQVIDLTNARFFDEAQQRSAPQAAQVIEELIGLAREMRVAVRKFDAG